MLTTRRRFINLAGFEPQKGDRLGFLTMPTRAWRHHHNRLQAWQAQLTETGYSEVARGYVVGPELIGRIGERRPVSLSAQAVGSTLAAQVSAIRGGSLHTLSSPVSTTTPLPERTGKGCSRTFSRLRRPMRTPCSIVSLELAASSPCLPR